MLYDLGSTAGQWTAWLPPMQSRRMDFRLFRLKYNGLGTAFMNTEGKMEVNSLCEVSFNYREIPEGEVCDVPALSVPIRHSANELCDFLQAVVDEAAKHGIYARNAPAQVKELDATKRHLEDMRMLAGVVTGVVRKPV